MNQANETLLFSTEFMIILTLLIPLMGIIIAGFVKNPKIRDISTILTGATLFLCVTTFIPLIRQGISPKLEIVEIFPNISLMFQLEWLGLLFALVASFLWPITTIYANGYMNGNKEKNQPRFYLFFALSIFAVMGIAFSGNMFTLFCFYELLTLATFPLVTHSGTEEAKRSGRIYLGILIGTSIFFLLPAIVWTYHLAGTLDFVKGGIIDFHHGGVLNNRLTVFTAGALLFLYMYGIGKAALMPFHRWLPAAMVAPTPVSALLHAVAVVKAGVFTVVKVIIYIFGTRNLTELINESWASGAWLTYAAGFTIIAASVVALRQDNLKKRLAYSTISQLSYVILAVSILAPKAVLAAGFHILAHAVGKITLFFAAGAIYTASKKKYVSELDGIGRRMPITMICFTIGALSMIGLPPAVGFLTKYYMLLGAFEYGNFFAIGVIILSTLLNAAYFLPIIFNAWFKPEKAGVKSHGEAPKAILFAISITGFLTIALFFAPDLFLWLAEEPSVR